MLIYLFSVYDNVWLELEEAHLSAADCCWFPGYWCTARWRNRLPSAQTPTRRNQTQHQRSTDTPASQRPGWARSAALNQRRTPAWCPSSHPNWTSKRSFFRSPGRFASALSKTQVSETFQTKEKLFYSVISLLNVLIPPDWRQSRTNPQLLEQWINNETSVRTVMTDVLRLEWFRHNRKEKLCRFHEDERDFFGLSC